ncbi:MAG: hypothetical protein AAF152_16950 [Cyanobacteria bacterium P01_A01_bin.114]
MLEPLSLAAATAIAKIVLDKFYEGAGKKLEESATKLGGSVVEKANEKIQQLGQLIWQRCFKGKPADVAQLPEQAAKPDADAEQSKLSEYLGKVLDQDDVFTQQVKQLAGEIHQVIVNMEDIKARNVQQNFGGQGLQVNDSKAPVIQAKDSPITINYGVAD